MCAINQRCNNPSIQKILTDEFVVSLFDVAKTKLKSEAIAKLGKSFETESKRKTNDETTRLSEKLIKDIESIEEPEYAVYLYKREISSQLKFDRFYVSNGEVFIDSTNTARGQISNVRKCYKSNTSKGRNGSGFILRPILSKVGCLGVVCFSKCCIPKSPETEKFLTSCMSAIGNRFLSYIFETEPTQNLLRSKTTDLRQYFPVCDTKSVVMFINIRDFNGSVNNDFEDWQSYDEYKKNYENIARIATDHYGVVVNFWGGGALIIFNVLLIEDIKCACRRSLCAALRVRKSLQGESEVKLGIAGNTGSVLFFGFGNEYESANNYYGYGKVFGEAKKWEHTISGRESIIHPSIPFNTPNDYEGHIILSTEFLECVCDNCRKHFDDDICIHSRLKIDNICGISSPQNLSRCQNNLKCNNDCSHMEDI